MVEFSTWQACQVVARHAIYEVPLRATLECLVQSALRRRGSVHLQREYRRLRSTTLKKLLATTRCGKAYRVSSASRNSFEAGLRACSGMATEQNVRHALSSGAGNFSIERSQLGLLSSLHNAERSSSLASVPRVSPLALALGNLVNLVA